MKKNFTIFVLCMFAGFAKAQNWQYLGQADSLQASNNAATYISLAVDNIGVLYMAFADVRDSNKVHVRKYNGTTWADVGMPGFSAANATSITIAIGKDGAPYVAYQDNATGNKAIVQKYSGTSWMPLGAPGFTAGAAGELSMAIDTAGTPYVVYQDNANSNKAAVKKYTGTTWVDVGAVGLSVGVAQGTKIAIARNGTPYIVYKDVGSGSKTIVKKFDGTTWVALGANVSNNMVSNSSIGIDTSGIPYVVYSDPSNGGKDSVKKYNGTAWVPVASITSVTVTNGNTSGNMIALAGNTPYIVCKDGFNPAVEKYDGANWVTVGSGMQAQVGGYTAIAIGNDYLPYIAYSETNNGGKASVKKYDGTNWKLLYATGIDVSGAGNPSVAMDASGVPYVAYADAMNGNKLNVKKYNGSAWVNVGIAGISTSAITNTGIAIAKNDTPYIVYVETNNITVKKFDGTNWGIVGIAGFAVNGANYVSIAIDTAGVPYVCFAELGTNYRSLATVKKYNGINWVYVGAPAISDGSASYTAIAIGLDNIPYITFQAMDANYNDAGVIVKKFDGATWINVGTPTGIVTKTSHNTIALDTAGMPYIAYQVQNSNTYQIKVQRYDGTNWTAIGYMGTSIYNRAISLVVGKNNIPYISYVDDSASKRVTVKRYENNNWLSLGSNTISAVECMYPSLAINSNKIVSVYQTGTSSTSGTNSGSFARQYLLSSLCDTVIGLSISNITTTTADINWVALIGVAGYEYVIDQTPANPVSGTLIASNTYTATGLSPNTIYYVHLRTNCSGSSYSAWITRQFKTLITACDTAIGLTVSNITTAAANISWIAVAGAAGYEYKIDQVGTNPTNGGTSITASTYAATSLIPNTIYYVHLRTDCSGGNYSPWITKQFKTQFATCDTVTGLTIANVTTTAADISWTAIAGVSGYEYKIDQVATNPTSGTTIATNTYTTTSLLPNTIYYVHLRTNCSGSIYSPWVTKLFKTIAVCDTVNGLSVTNIATTTAYISWNTVAGITGYEYKIDQTATPPSTAGVLLQYSVFNATSLTPNTTYYIHLRTECSINNYSPWITKEFKTLAICDTATGLAITNITATTVDAGWAAVTGATGYEYKIDQVGAAPYTGTPTTVNTCNATSLIPNAVYYIHLRTDCGNKNYSAWITKQFKTSIATCDTVTGLAITNITTTSADVGWGAVPGAAGYEYILDQTATAPAAASISTTSTTYNATGLTQGTLYFFHLRTDCGSGTFSAWINKPFTTANTGVEMVATTKFSMTVYPNPTTDILSVSIKGGANSATLKLTDLSGKTLRTLRVENAKYISIDMQGLASGMYWLRYTDSIHSKVVSIQKM